MKAIDIDCMRGLIDIGSSHNVALPGDGVVNPALPSIGRAARR